MNKETIPHNVMEQYATLIISMSTDFLQGRITKEHYADTLASCVKNMYDTNTENKTWELYPAP